MKFSLPGYMQDKTHQPAAPKTITHAHTYSRTAESRPAYQRSRDLPKLIAATPNMLATPTKANRALLIRLIKNELRKERLNTQLRGHIYQVERHLLLVQALKAELNPAGPDENTCGPAGPTRAKPRESSIKKRHLLLRDSVFKHFTSSEH